MDLTLLVPGTLRQRDRILNNNFSQIDSSDGEVRDLIEDTQADLAATQEDLAGTQADLAATKTDLAGTKTRLSQAKGLLDSHIADKNNPHNVTAAQLGLANAYVYKGSINTYSELPATPSTGDVYNIVSADAEHNVNAGDNVAWSGSAWDNLSGVFDTSALEALISANTAAIAQNAGTIASHTTSIATLTTQTQANATGLSQLQTTVNGNQTQVNNNLAKKVGVEAQTFTDAEKAQARTNINAASDSDVVKHTVQTLTDTQKAQVHTNIGLIQILEELILENGGTQAEIDALST